MDREGIPFLLAPAPVPALAFDDPDAPRASAWLGRDADDPEVIVLGAPFGGGSISGARCDLAPAAVREALGRLTTFWSDEEISIDALAAADAGDVSIEEEDVEKAQSRIAATVAALRARRDVPIVLLGGDNSVTVGGARGAHADGLITFDAHHDVRDPARRVTNGCPVRQLVAGGLSSVAQIGIHGFANGEPLARWAREHEIAWLTVPDVRREGIDGAAAWALGRMGDAERIWVDIDLDVLDRAFAPGAPAALPGGLAPGDLIRAAFLLGSDERVCGLDIVELDPEADVAQTTARAGAMVMAAFCAGVVSR